MMMLTNFRRGFAACPTRSRISLFNKSHTSPVAIASLSTTTSFAWLDEQTGMYKNFVNGQFVSSTSAGETLPVKNPATNDVIGYVPETTVSEFDQVVADAQQYFEDEWKYVPIQQKQRIMLKYQQKIRDYTDDIATLITLENGKTFTDAKGDVFRGLEMVESACFLSPHLLGDSLSNISSTMDCVTYREPLGVCAGICPFNFPAMIPLWMFPLAITAGNTFVMKPSEKTPGAALLLAQLAYECGVPEKALQVVHGSKPLVDQICTHPSIRAISFVGSNVAGEYIHQQGSSHGKRVQANLGAKNHGVILPDADREATTKALVGAAFGAAGQRCMALSTLVLVGSAQEWIYDIVEQASKLKVGYGMDESSDLGPVITPESKKRIEAIIDQAVQQGATLALDGRQNVSVPGYPNGNFINPTVLSNVSPTNICYTEEIFGPVLVCLSVDTLEEAIDVIRKSPYGNGCALFTSSGSAARKFSSEVPVGQVSPRISSSLKKRARGLIFIICVPLLQIH